MSKYYEYKKRKKKEKVVINTKSLIMERNRLMRLTNNIIFSSFFPLIVPFYFTLWFNHCRIQLFYVFFFYFIFFTFDISFWCHFSIPISSLMLRIDYCIITTSIESTEKNEKKNNNNITMRNKIIFSQRIGMLRYASYNKINRMNS